LRIKVIGFKVNVARPTYNKTLDASEPPHIIGNAILQALEKSDFLSIRKVN